VGLRRHLERRYRSISDTWRAQTRRTATRGEGGSGSLRAIVSRRDQITLSDAELLELLGGERVAIVSSLGPRGWPHSMPMWFVPRAGEIWVWTYGKSQKVRNLERDPRATLLVETGHEYGELRGAMIEAEAEIHRDFETVLGFAEELTLRYAEGISSVEGDAKAALEAQAPKRVAIHFKPVRVATWDHRKLGGTY
jgi:PPOX class probable F420-dependent enzyme